jgi:hypothetical protein
MHLFVLPDCAATPEKAFSTSSGASLALSAHCDIVRTLFQAALISKPVTFLVALHLGRRWHRHRTGQTRVIADIDDPVSGTAAGRSTNG